MTVFQWLKKIVDSRRFFTYFQPKDDFSLNNLHVSRNNITNYQMLSDLKIKDKKAEKHRQNAESKVAESGHKVFKNFDKH